jgi:CheY-like chemotaxis protein
MRRKILIVEDATLVVDAYLALLAGDDLEILTAATLLGALDLIEAHPDVALVVLDGLFPRDEGESPYPEPGRACSGEKFLANARYRGPIIACSSEPSVNERLLRSGATRAVQKGRDVVAAIRETLAALDARP